MNLSLEKLDIVSGNLLSEELLVSSTAYVSKWLEFCAPDTKPKSSKELLMTAKDSFYAMYGDIAVGHVALTGLNVVKKSNKPHLIVESLVVHPGLTGQGIGNEMLQTVLGDVSYELTEGQLSSEAGTIVSALACRPSWHLFEKAGFSYDDELSMSLQSVEPYQEINLADMLSSGKQIVSLWMPAK